MFTGNALVTTDPIDVVGREQAEQDSAHGREKVNQSNAVWTELVKKIKKKKQFYSCMAITVGSPSEAWKIPLSLVGESSEAAKNRLKKEKSGYKNVPCLDLCETVG